MSALPLGSSGAAVCSDCGHPRSAHIEAGAYPTLCVHEDGGEVCACLEFSDDPTPIYGELRFVAAAAPTDTTEENTDG